MADYANEKPQVPAFGGGDASAAARGGALVAGGNADDDVARPSPIVVEQRADWDLMRALLGGTKAMRAAGAKYLPLWPKESSPRWTRRKSVSTLFPALKRTVTTLAARPFSKPLTLNDDIPAPIKELAEKDVDMQGRSLHTFGSEAMQDLLSYGFGGILVDHKVSAPVVQEGRTPTVAEERAAGMRPYMVLLKAQQILGWRAELRNGAHTLTMLRFMEEVEEPDGEWNIKHVEQIRVLEPGRWRTYRKRQSSEGKSQWFKHLEGATTLDKVPFAPFYGERCGFMVGKSPLLELGHLNVKHWQSQSDQDHLLHTARVPILALFGLVEDPKKPFTMEIGTAGVLTFPKDVDMRYVEHTGAAIESGEKALEMLKEEMRQSGAELLVLKPNPATATEIASDNAVGMCDLQRMTLELQAALDAALGFMAEWMKQAKGGTCKLFTDFGAATLAEAGAQFLLSMANSGRLSDKTLFSEVKRRGILSQEVDFDEEQELIDAQPPKLGAVLPGLPGAMPPPKPGVPPAPTPAPTKPPAAPPKPGATRKPSVAPA